VGIICAPGTNIVSSPITFLTSALRDPDNASIVHTAVDATITTTCCCRFQGDLDSSGNFDIVDLVSLVDYVFRNGAAPFQDPGCPANRAEINCDLQPNIVDVVSLVEVAFRNGDPNLFICNPCDCNPFPTGCP
jgi:hypothetical protein